MTLDSRIVTEDFQFEPDEAGNYIFEAIVEPLEGEVVEANNRSERGVTVLDDFSTVTNGLGDAAFMILANTGAVDPLASHAQD